MIAVLDSFHFDLSYLDKDKEGLVGSVSVAGPTSEGGEGQGGVEGAGEEQGGIEGAGDGDEQGGIEGAMEGAGGEQEGAVGAVAGEEEHEVVEEEERGMENECSVDKKEALARKIYRSIVKTILPNLQQVLTKKVTQTHMCS